LNLELWNGKGPGSNRRGSPLALPGKRAYFQEVRGLARIWLIHTRPLMPKLLAMLPSLKPGQVVSIAL
jgi:hypothetical protein